jgi:hypothetical protein
MTSKKWTPGPWQTNGSHIYAPDRAIIAQVHNPGSKATDYPLVANRDLMAAAPELYEGGDALNELVEATQRNVTAMLTGEISDDEFVSVIIGLLDGPEQREAQHKLRAALAKARNEQVKQIAENANCSSPVERPSQHGDSNDK